MNKKLETEIQHLHNKLDAIYANIGSVDYEATCDGVEIMKSFHERTRPEPDPLKDLKWEEADQYEKEKKEFEESIPQRIKDQHTDEVEERLGYNEQ